MSSDNVMECMEELYQGECLGELLLDAMLPLFDDPDARLILGTLAQFETETKARMRPVMIQLGLPTLTAETARATAEEMASGFAGSSVKQIMAYFQTEISERYLPRYRDIAAIAAVAGDPLAIELANDLVTHESLILELADRVVAGEAAPHSGVAAVLRYPVPAYI